MSQLITIQVGQCGNQIGGAFWPLVLQEYGISNIPGIKSIKKKQNVGIHQSFHTFFHVPDGNIADLNSFVDLKLSKVKARVLLIDMEDGVVSKLKNAPLGAIFDEKCIITNYPGSGNNWAEGHCFHGPKYKLKILNALRKIVDLCDSLQGFFVLFSVGGGTGSGLGTYVLKLLQDYYPHVERFVACVYPTGTEDVITCPYNMLLSTKEVIDNASCVFPVENRALLDIVTRQWNNKHSLETTTYLAACKPFQDMNSIIVNMLLHLTSGSRFAGSLNVDLNEINTNMVPFPRMQFLASGYSPFTVSTSQIIKKTNKQIKDNLFISASSRNNELLKIDSTGLKSVLMGTTLIGRGDFTVSDMRSYVEKLQLKAKFTCWSRKAVKIGLCDTPPFGHNAAMLALFNTSSISNLFTTINNHFVKLYQKRAHIHHYQQVAEFDDSYFEDCQNTLLSTIASYKELEIHKPIIIPRLKPVE